MGVVGLAIGAFGRDLGDAGGGQDEAQAEVRAAGVGSCDDTAGHGIALGPEGCDDEAVGAVGEGDVCAQAVEGQAFGEIGHGVLGNVDQEAVGRAEEEEVEQDLALGREEAGVNGAAIAEAGKRIGHEAVKEACGVRAGHGDDATVFENGQVGGHACRCPWSVCPRIEDGARLKELVVINLSTGGRGCQRAFDVCRVALSRSAPVM